MNDESTSVVDREPGDAGLSAVQSLGRYLSLGKSFNLLDSFLTYVSFSLIFIHIGKDERMRTTLKGQCISQKLKWNQ